MEKALVVKLVGVSYYSGMNQDLFAVAATVPQTLQEAEQLAKILRVPLIKYPLNQTDVVPPYLLVCTPGFLGIQKKEDKKWQPFYIDFTKGQLHYRSKQAGLRSELIARAMGAKPKDQPKILDATAGLGKDAFILASLGFHLTMLETSPIVYYLLADGLKRARNSLETAEIADRLHLIHADAIDWLQNPPFSPDIIYLDPMFPERKKSASVKKDMVFLQELLGKCENQENLFSKAFACAKKRVVVKRPRKAACLSTERKPDFAFEGKSSRFDIYLNNRR